MRLALFALAVLAAASAAAQEGVTLETRGGATQSFFIPNMGNRKPEAAALLFPGGAGNINLRSEAGVIKFSTGNFLMRSRHEFVRNNIVPVIVDAPSDQKAGMSDEFRRGVAHVTDIRAVIAEVAQRYPGLPLFLVGTSRSTVSVANLAVSLRGEIAGAVLSASAFLGAHSGPGRHAKRAPLLLSFNWAALPVPVLLVHHAEDACEATPYEEAARLSRRYAFPLITVRGGHTPKSDACAPFSPHGFYGKESETVDAIAGWMLGRPFAKDIR